MKVLMINGSPDPKGCISTALQEAVKVFEKEGVECEIMHIGNQDIRGCIACGHCHKAGRCVFDDAVNEAAAKLAEARRARTDHRRRRSGTPADPGA